MSDVFERSVAGKPLSIRVGKFAQQANGAVAVQYGNTVILATACASSEPREGGRLIQYLGIEAVEPEQPVPHLMADHEDVPRTG